MAGGTSFATCSASCCSGVISGRPTALSSVARDEAVGGATMRLGIASERRAEFTEEINEGVTALGRERGWEVSEVADQAGERACDVLLAIGNVDLFPDLVRRPRTAPRVLWLCEG